MENITSLKRTARIAGLLYLVIAFTAPYAHMYVPSKIYVRENAVVTTSNILSNEFLFRTCIVVNLLEGIIFLLLALTLYRLFLNVDNHLARLMTLFVTVQLPIVFVLSALKITALMVAQGNLAPGFFQANKPEFTMLFLKMNEYGMLALELLWGLWLLPFGMLVYRSRFIPRILGVLLIVAGAGYMTDSFTFMLFPQYHSYTKIVAMIFSGVGQLSIIAWFLNKGVREHILINVLAEKRNIYTSKYTSAAGKNLITD